MTILNTSVSGMLADSNWLSSISQNVANANTTGYKNIETEFSTLVDQVSSAVRLAAASRPASRSLNALQGNVVTSHDDDQSRRPGLGLLRRLRLERGDLPDPQRLLRRPTPPAISSTAPATI